MSLATAVHHLQYVNTQQEQALIINSRPNTSGSSGICPAAPYIVQDTNQANLLEEGEILPSPVSFIASLFPITEDISSLGDFRDDGPESVSSPREYWEDEPAPGEPGFRASLDSISPFSFGLPSPPFVF